MNPVKACPKNLVEIENASTRLGCGFDQYGNNQYLCLPNTEKSTLVEFCYKGLMGLQEKGNCLEVSNGVLSNYNCTSFQLGCPDKPVKNHEFYKHVACQAINFKHHCYRLDPACPKEITCKDCDDNVYRILFACVFGLLILLIVIVITCVYRAMKERKFKRETRKDTESCDGMLIGNQDTDRQLDVVHTEKDSTATMRNSIQTLHMNQTFSGDYLLQTSTARNLNQDDIEDEARLVDAKAKITNSDQSHTDRQLDVVHTEKDSTATMRNSIQTLHMNQTFSGDYLLQTSTARNLNQDDIEDEARLVDAKAKITNSDQSRQRKYTETSIESYLQPQSTSDGKIDLVQANEEHFSSNSSKKTGVQGGITCKRTRHDTDTSIESYLQEEIDDPKQTHYSTV